MVNTNAEALSPLSAVETAPANEKQLSTSGHIKLPIQGRIGFVGLGRMGKAMATNLAIAGHDVVAYVRRIEQMEQLATFGLNPTTAIADVCACEFIITMVPDDDAVCQVVFGHQDAGGVAKGMLPGAIHLSMSTISTAAAARLAAEHARYSQGYVAAPVFGNPDAAKARQLFIIAAGALRDIGRCLPIFDALGQQAFFVGNDPAAANLVKLAGNAMSAASLEILGEVIALARKRGLDPQQLIAILTGTMYGGRLHRVYGEKIATRQYGSGGFLLSLALKDIRLALNEAERAGVPMPSVSVVRDRLISGIARGYSDRDWSALGLLAAEEAGLNLEVTKVPL
jgi:3-hydroxyisobutyrate dehydrogenase-like beta-hydroxyacid dehydrogenase